MHDPSCWWWTDHRELLPLRFLLTVLGLAQPVAIHNFREAPRLKQGLPWWMHTPQFILLEITNHAGAISSNPPTKHQTIQWWSADRRNWSVWLHWVMSWMYDLSVARLLVILYWDVVAMSQSGVREAASCARTQQLNATKLILAYHVLQAHKAWLKFSSPTFTIARSRPDQSGVVFMWACVSIHTISTSWMAELHQIQSILLTYVRLLCTC